MVQSPLNWWITVHFSALEQSDFKALEFPKRKIIRMRMAAEFMKDQLM